MQKKIAFFAFNGETLCFMHILLNAIDMHEKGYDVKIVLEGAATRMARELSDLDKPFSNLFQKARQLNVIDCVCKACANKMESLEAAKEQQLCICDELLGHPSMSRYIDQGYEIIMY